MAAPEFFFAIEFSDPAPSSDMLREVVARVLAQAGANADRAPKMIDALQTAMAQNTSAGGPACRVTFTVTDGHLEIVVTSAAGQLWQTTQSLA